MTFWCPTINLNALAMSDMCWLKATSCLQTCMTIESYMSQRLWTVLLSVVWIKGSNSLPSSVSYIGESVLIWRSCLQWLPWKCGDGYHPYSGAIMQCNIFILVMFQENFSCLLTVEIVQSSQYVHLVFEDFSAIECFHHLGNYWPFHFPLFCLITTSSVQHNVSKCEKTFFF